MADTILEFDCPRCNYHVDSASAIGAQNAVAYPGDISLCLFCGAPLEFDEYRIPRWLTGDEVMRLPTTLRVQIFAALVAIVTLRPPLKERETWRRGLRLD